MRELSRRSFVVEGAGLTALGMAGGAAAADPARRFRGPLCLFSKHLPDLKWQELGRVVKALKFDGVDLTVRPGGHVLPERAAADLEPAVRAIRAEGLEVPMVTTALLSGDDPTARPILLAAGRLGIPFMKPGYYRYLLADVRAELKSAGEDLAKLVAVAKECKVQIGFHNHAGNVGGPIWDIASVIDTLDPEWIGYYFDIRHSVVEGGGIGWKAATRLVAPRLKMIAAKDFFWEKRPGKGWQQTNCPLGEGMVDWAAYLQFLAQIGFQGPVSLHVEYDIPGKTKAEQQENTIAAAERDLRYLRKGLDQAYGT
jgi:L-ribulose-5-phosphate 3-epimerase